MGGMIEALLGLVADVVLVGLVVIGFHVFVWLFSGGPEG